MSAPQFEIRPINLDSFAIDDHGKTVALLTPQGNVDWILRSPMQEGRLIDKILKETHLGLTYGVMLQFHVPNPAIEASRSEAWVSQDRKSVTVEVEGKTKDGKWWGMTRAILRTSRGHARYEWDCETTIKHLGAEPVTVRGIEYCNIYPGKTGLGFMFEKWKEYDATLIVDRSGVIWQFPHQHLMHYSGCSHGIPALQCQTPALAGFFGERMGAPVVVCKSSTGQPDWGICDMYYDLHCQARMPEPILPEQELRYAYEIKFLTPAESKSMLEQSRPIPVSGEDIERHFIPRLTLGMNSFTERVEIEGYDDSAGFRPKPPVKVWDREVGHRERGSLRITNDSAKETVWSAEPPVPIPSQHRLRIRAKLKTRGVTGHGAFLRARYFKFEWRPEPHCETTAVLESEPIGGTSEDWMEIELPPLEVPPEHFDHLLWFDFVLNGQGVAWLTDMDIDLQPIEEKPPALEADSEKQKKRRRPKAASGSGGGGLLG